MRLDLAIFAERHLEGVTLCSWVTPANAKHLTLVSEDQIAVLSCEDGPSERIWLRVISNLQKDPEGIHFHIDCSRASDFPDGPPPDSDLRPSEFGDYLERFRDTTLNATMRARFTVPRANLRKDSVINVLTNVTVGPQNSGARLTGSRYEVNEGPVKEIRWCLSDEDGGELIEASVRSRQQAKVSETVLVSLFAPIQAAFRNLILEEGVD